MVNFHTLSNIHFSCTVNKQETFDHLNMLFKSLNNIKFVTRILLGNKGDKARNNRQVTRDQIIDVVEHDPQKPMKYFETSALTGSQFPNMFEFLYSSISAAIPNKNIDLCSMKTNIQLGKKRKISD